MPPRQPSRRACFGPPSRTLAPKSVTGARLADAHSRVGGDNFCEVGQAGSLACLKNRGSCVYGSLSIFDDVVVMWAGFMVHARRLWFSSLALGDSGGTLHTRYEPEAFTATLSSLHWEVLEPARHVPNRYYA